MKNFTLIIVLVFLTGNLFAQVDTIEVFSNAMNKSLKAAVVKPKGYDHRESAYPTVYLLHGGAGKFSDWLLNAKEENLLVNLANQYNVIIITPGVGPFSYFYDSPLMDSVKYETYIIKELIPHIDQVYNTINKREARAITGLSMGGHGAMILSANNPELFIAAGSMSGVMNIDPGIWNVDNDYRNRVKERHIAVLGEIQFQKPFSRYTAVGLVDQMKKTAFPFFLIVE